VKEIKAALANYISILSNSLSQTHRTEDRPKYIGHLAQAAVMSGLIHGGAKISEMEEVLLQERQSYGRDYLSVRVGKRRRVLLTNLLP